MTVYVPDRTNRPTSFTVPADGELVRAASVNPAFQAGFDVLAWLRYGSIENWRKVVSAFGPARDLAVLVAAVFWTAAAFVFTVTFLGFGGAKPKSANRSTASLPLVATR